MVKTNICQKSEHMWTPASAYTQLLSLSTDLSCVSPLHKSAKMDGK